MAQIKEILVKLTKSYQDRLKEAKAIAEKMVRTAEAARQAGKAAETKEAQPGPKK